MSQFNAKSLLGCLHTKKAHIRNLEKNKKTKQNNGCVSHSGLAIYIKKGNLKAKEEFWKFKYFTMQKYNLLKNPLKETKIHQDIITL